MVTCSLYYPNIIHWQLTVINILCKSFQILNLVGILLISHWKIVNAFTCKQDSYLGNWIVGNSSKMFFIFEEFETEVIFFGYCSKTEINFLLIINIYKIFTICSIGTCMSAYIPGWPKIIIIYFFLSVSELLANLRYASH